MGLSFLTPLFLAGFIAVAVPVIIHLIRRHRGRTIQFPSLMFLRQLPVQTVQRRTIRDWPLLLLRIGALVLIALAFARPVLQLGAEEDGLVQDALREVVVVLDRSWSMARGDRWERALDEARSTLGSLVTPDRGSLVVFDGMGSVVVEPTLDPTRVSAALDTIQPGWGGTQIGAGLQAAGGILQASDRSRREIVLISDFQRRGWEDGPRDRLPEGTTLITSDVGDDGLGSIIVSDVTLEYTFTEGRQRVRPVARVIRQGEEAPSEAEVLLELDEQETERQSVEITSEGAISVGFAPITLPEEGIRGAVRLEPASGEAAGEPFRFVVSPSEVLSVILVEPVPNSGRNTAPYLESALTVQGGVPVQVQTRRSAAFFAEELEAVDLVILNDIPLPSGASASAIQDHVQTGGGLLIVTGPESAPEEWSSAWNPFLPARPGEIIERDPARGASLAQVDRDHPIFTVFQGAGGSGLGTPRFFRYRRLDMPLPPAPAEGEPSTEEAEQGPRVLARFDDGSPALAQRSIGAGRVLVWTSTFDNEWSDFPLHPVFLPVVREVVQYTGARRESVPYFTVGQPLDSRFLLIEAGIVSEGDQLPESPGAETPADSPVLGLLAGPDGTGLELTGTGGDLVQLSSPGFYEVREGAESSAVQWVLAVNADVREADPARMDPEELMLAVAPSGPTEPDAGIAQNSAMGDLTEGTDARTVLEEGERRQGVWRFLLLAAILLLLGESVLAGRRKPLAKQVV